MPILIQPFVENAVEHGLKPIIHQKEVMLTIRYMENTADSTLLCTISDNSIDILVYRRKRSDASDPSLSTIITDERLAPTGKDNPLSGFHIQEPAETGNSECTATLFIPITRYV